MTQSKGFPNRLLNSRTDFWLSGEMTGLSGEIFHAIPLNSQASSEWYWVGSNKFGLCSLAACPSWISGSVQLIKCRETVLQQLSHANLYRKPNKEDIFPKRNPPCLYWQKMTTYRTQFTPVQTRGRSDVYGSSTETGWCSKQIQPQCSVWPFTNTVLAGLMSGTVNCWCC